MMLLLRYRGLPCKDSIRLLTLHPSSNDQSPITCTLQHALLSDAIAYEALSYTWGDATPRQAIYLNDGANDGARELHVTRNCYNAMRHLRHRDQDRTLWVDAICIDQENLIERADQVRIMNKIYGNASSVVVHLGEETPGSRLLFADLANADAAILKGQYDLPYPSDVIIEELEELIRRPWFRRVWVLQEVHLKKAVTFMCGPLIASFSALKECLQGYKKNLRVTKQLRPFVVDMMYQSQRYNLWELLLLTSDSLATDPRDRIFALLSLVHYQQEDMDFLIDYAQGVEKILTKTALLLLAEVGTKLLAAVGHPHNLEMASWIPNWTQNLPFNKYIDFLHSTPCIDRVSVLHQVVVEQKFLCLHVMGMRYAEIICMSGACFFTSVEDAAAQMETMYYGLGNLRGLLSPRDILDGVKSFDGSWQAITDTLSRMDGHDLHRLLHRGYCIRSGDGGYSRQPDMFFRSLQQCKIAILDNGHFSIVPEAARNRDVLCILQGTEYVCILRQDLDRYRRLLSGNCYVLDDDYEGDISFASKQYLENHKHRVETFKIR